MSRLLQITFITTLVTFIFSGCASKVPPKNFALHNQTVQGIKQKDINVQVSNVKLTGDALNNKYGLIALIDEEEIKTHLLTNINKFYNNNPINSKIYKIDVDMNFDNKKFAGDLEVGIDGIYKIYRENQLIKTIDVSSNYLAEFELTFKDVMLGGFTNQTNQDFKYDSLEKTGYAEDDTVSLSAKHANVRLALAYAGAIRLNFAKFLQKFNELVNSENQTLVINK
ncbi:hypothetical protein [Aliarcobacter butzleri]|uniref:hypothetical protein n=1 Tax=Aliarcobacter butzleri TaxID=28197 RepID=UPI001EDBA3C4|nr:hypothetical protein [Aliarcobacter butzleri]MCG3671363.1 hypothetical protein [Aliarcobacter butzleri]MCG3689757.1 hypothetical protein [Aliarcobacter butzleri]